jgi:hypothetical protein
MLRDVLLSLVKLMFGGCGGSQEDLLAIQAACLKHIVLTVPDLVQAENRQQQKPFCRRLSLLDDGAGFFLPVSKSHPAFWTAVLGIRDIFVRIQIRGFVPLTNRSRSDSFL